MKILNMIMDLEYLSVILIIILIVSGCNKDINPTEAKNNEIPEPSGHRLREIVSDKNIIIGGTTGSWSFGTNTSLILDREFDYVSPENEV